MTSDVLIVGAGPAGSTLAALLAGRGFHVVMIDCAAFPRDKICGEFLGPGCRAPLEHIGALGEVERSARPVRGMSIRSACGAHFSALYPDGQTGFAIRRSDLDHLLLENALRRSATCFHGFRAEQLIVEGGTVRGVVARSRDGGLEAFRARIVAGADGRNSVVARRLGLVRRDPTHRRTALCIHYRDVPGAGDCAEIYLGDDGYGILNPLGGSEANVSVVVAHEDFPRYRGRVAHWFGERLREAEPIEEVRILGPLAHRVTRSFRDGAILVGDAAGFYDPFTGEGVYMAMGGAVLAAEAIGEALARGDAGGRFLARYDAARRREFDARYRFEALVQGVILRPRLADFAVRGLARAAGAAGVLLSVFGGLLPPQRLLSRAVLGNLVLGSGS